MVDKQTPAPPVKTNYTIKLEALVPITLTYNITAETEQEAIQMMERGILSPTVMSRPKLSALRKLKASVYLRGQNIVKTIKNYVR